METQQVTREKSILTSRIEGENSRDIPGGLWDLSLNTHGCCVVLVPVAPDTVPPRVTPAPAVVGGGGGGWLFE